MKFGEEGLARSESLPEPSFELLFKMSLEVAEPVQVGQTHAGNRRVIGVGGGVFEGPGLKGRVLPGGSDWIVVRRDGVLIQDVRIVLHTDDGHNVLMSYRGMRHGPELVIERVDNGRPRPLRVLLSHLAHLRGAGRGVRLAQRATGVRRGPEAPYRRNLCRLRHLLDNGSADYRPLWSHVGRSHLNRSGKTRWRLSRVVALRSATPSAELQGVWSNGRENYTGYPVEGLQPLDTLCAENLKTLVGHQPLIPSGPAECSGLTEHSATLVEAVTAERMPSIRRTPVPPVLKADPSGVPRANPLSLRIEASCYSGFRAAHEAFLVGIRSGYSR